MGKAGILTKLQIAAVLFLAFSSAGRAYAAAECSLLQIVIDGKEIVSYIECDSNIQSVDAQAAQYPCENVEIATSKDISIHTVILIDNSLSISENNRKNIKNILRQYVQGLPENETVSLAVFGEDIQFLAEKSQNTAELAQMIDEIEFHNQNTYLTDYLFQTLEKIKNNPEYTRFIVISDGVDNKAIGITKEELTAKLKETTRQIDTIGHIYKDNSSELKNMFALSRITGGKEFLIEDFENIQPIVEEIHDFSNIYAVKMNVPQNVMDGGSRRILLNIHTDGGDVEVTGEASMPFGLIEKETEIQTEIETETVEPASEPEPESTLEPQTEPAPQKKNVSIGADKIAGIAVLIIAVVALILYQRKKKGRDDKKPKKNKPAAPVKPIMPVYNPEEDGTMILDADYLLVLKDRLNPERIFRYPMSGHVIVGRNIDMVQIAIDYNRTVSGQHCEFYMENNRFFIRDMNSANHTYLEGKMVRDRAEIISGNIVRLGEAEFCVEIMPM